MKKMLLALTLILTGCVKGGTWQEEYYPFDTNPPGFCAVSESNVYIINGIPSLKYICNR